MITFLEGKLAEKEPARAVLGVNGVGYELHVSLNTYDQLPAPGAMCRLLTYEHIREDAHALYGFATEGERRLFLLLIGVSGIGPRIAMTALSGFSPRELKAAIAQADVKRLSSISGIGKKTAERMVVELRDKISAGEALEATAGAEPASPQDLRARDAVLALISLGYKQAEAQALIRKVAPELKPDAGVEDLIRKALGGG